LPVFSFALGAILREVFSLFEVIPPMSTLSVQEAEVTMNTDDFSALEERVMRAVEVVKQERTARAEAERSAARLQSELDAQSAQLELTREQVRTLEREREHVRQRVERLLKQIDEIA
jgi:septal ring factor EnvC (AmiA/AmiB activator)